MLNINGLDLNLLITLNELLKDPSVTRVAKKLNLSQPSVSVHLTKLRTALSDPLFLPGPNGMRPTARSEQLRQPIIEVLDIINNSVLSPEKFIPKTDKRTWVIQASDYAEKAVLLHALSSVRILSPNTKIAVIDPSNRSNILKPNHFDIDLVFHVSADSSSGCRCRKLFTEKYVFTCRKGHSQIKSKPTLQQFINCSYVIISDDGGGFVGNTDIALTNIGLRRNVVLSVPHFIFAVHTIMSSDLVAMLPYRLVYDNPLLEIYEPPVNIPPFDLFMIWNEKYHRDNGHKWLRELIIESIPKL
ncbi:MAG: HTH-type transcriptional regulator SyrM 1 [Candidatus Celerinatantimonas neptuna]|nr:MAG: HTH-type transcriptional regulator SyrM 1 [Candidatus Celerinatantimonas neptuna]